MTIPADYFVSINPGVLSAGGGQLTMNGVFITGNAPNFLQSFADAGSVANWYGSGSDEANAAAVYFQGFDNSQTKPSQIYFAPFITAPTAAQLLGAQQPGLTLTQVQAASGTLTITINGTPVTTANINLSAATSFTSAASAVQTALASTLAGITCAYNATRNQFVITSPTTGAASTIGFATSSGNVATVLGLTQASGAQLSQGSDVQTPGQTMDAVKLATLNWATYSVIQALSPATSLLFAQWQSTQNNRFCYVPWDSTASVLTTTDTASLAYLLKINNVGGVCDVYAPNLIKAAFVMGAVASVDYTQINGRADFAFKSQSGLSADVTDVTSLQNLSNNGANAYIQTATANQGYSFFFPGQVSGNFKWLDTYINQIWLNNALQAALMTLLTSVRTIPYNQRGYSLIQNAMSDPIQTGLTNGVIVPGTDLSAQQIGIINSEAGNQGAANSVAQNGYYLQVLDPGAVVRANRGSPIVNFWYSDGGSVHKINVPSVVVQ